MSVHSIFDDDNDNDCLSMSTLEESHNTHSGHSGHILDIFWTCCRSFFFWTYSMKSLKNIVKRLKIPRGQTSITIALIVVIVVLLVVVVVRGGREEGYLGDFKTAEGQCKMNNEIQMSDGLWNATAKDKVKCKNRPEGRPECKGAIALFKDAVPNVNGGKPVLLQYDGTGWQKYRKCTSWISPNTEFSLPSSGAAAAADTATATAPTTTTTTAAANVTSPTVPSTKPLTLLERFFALFNFGANKIKDSLDSTLEDKPVHLMFTNCETFLLGVFEECKHTGNNTDINIHTLGGKAGKHEWIFRPVDQVGGKRTYRLQNVMRSTEKCAQEYLCVSNVVGSSGLYMGTFAQASDPAGLWFVRTLGEGVQLLSKARADTGNENVVLGVPDVTNNCSAQRPLLTPWNSSAFKQLKITPVPTAATAATAAGATHPAELEGGYKMVKSAAELRTDNGDKWKFILKLQGTEYGKLHTYISSSISALVTTSTSLSSTNIEWLIALDHEGNYIWRPKSRNDTKSYVGAITQVTSDTEKWGDYGAKCTGTPRRNRGAGNQPYTCNHVPNCSMKMISGRRGCYADKPVTPSRKCGDVQVVNRWDFTGVNHKLGWDYNDRFIWKFNFDAQGVLTLSNMAAEKNSYGCTSANKFLKISPGGSAALSNTATKFLLYKSASTSTSTSTSTSAQQASTPTYNTYQR
jgi:hypothetical protein